MTRAGCFREASEIIVSSRFYRFCREQKLGIDFVPVRIDEG